ncbi:hypothetical protein [Alkalibacterium pelagium]|uniref:Uncharacterized protein n=1 Tax=Alkalibacterium pelagium TaxID=426702 RepID=A0A1H7HRU3_9LACT|nr:hypothetical protein [Alkalibacterium pelagium]GEN50365.1 hypothetical protein APE02nite_10300 [Alkalibacterium pelagium]SEK52894.1 hypothetical protein SAMN04488099_103156 [Alkalibacterium pelagium]
MEELNIIKNEINKVKTHYSDSLLLGLVNLNTTQIDHLEKRAVTSLRSYSQKGLLRVEESYYLSLYAVHYAKHLYSSGRYWEDLSSTLGFDEGIIREAFITAMKYTYKKEKWAFYRTTRNEYVETIRMHSVIGNDHSGDNIIYGFYLVYLKDFETQVTKEKLDLFFPYLKEIFQPFESTDEGEYVNTYNGIAYVRGLMPKSFARAFNINDQAVGALIEQMFIYFDTLNNNTLLPASFDGYLKKKIEASMASNNNFINDYTKPLVKNRRKNQGITEVVTQSYKGTEINIPSHFIDFKSNERHKADVIFYDGEKVVKRLDLTIKDGAIGWRSEAATFRLRSPLTRFRYEIRKISSGEIVYDSGSKFYTKNRKVDANSIETVKEEVPVLHKILSNNKKEQKSLHHLKTGEIYSIKTQKNVKIVHAHTVQHNNETIFVMKDKTAILINEERYTARNNHLIVSVSNNEYLSTISLVDNNELKRVYSGNLRFKVRLGVPYELSQLSVDINGEIIDGTELRRTVLKEVSLYNEGDFKFTFDFYDLFKTGKNTLKVFIGLNNLKLPIADIEFYYSNAVPFSYEWVTFNQDHYINLQSDAHLTINQTKDRQITVQTRDNSLIWALSSSNEKEESKVIESNEFIHLPLVSVERGIVSQDDKKEVLQEVYDSSYLKTEDYIKELIGSIGINSFFHQIADDKEQMIKTLTNILMEVDGYFIKLIVSELHLILNNKVVEGYITERYILPLITSLNLRHLNNTYYKVFSQFLNQMKTDLYDTDLLITFKPKEGQIKLDKASKLIVNELSTHRRNRAFTLYKIAADTSMTRYKTINSVKDMYKKNPSRSYEEYIEIVEWYREFLVGNPIDITSVHTETFIDMLLFHIQQTDALPLAEYMNRLEASSQLIDSEHGDIKKYVRTRLVDMAEVFNLEVTVR